jgi:hypothetical protein
VFLGCEVDRNEDPLQQVCEDVEAMEIVAQGGRFRNIGRTGNRTGGERGQTTESNLNARTVLVAFSFRIFGS